MPSRTYIDADIKPNPIYRPRELSNVNRISRRRLEGDRLRGDGERARRVGDRVGTCRAGEAKIAKRGHTVDSGCRSGAGQGTTAADRGCDDNRGARYGISTAVPVGDLWLDIERR